MRASVILCVWSLNLCLLNQESPEDAVICVLDFLSFYNDFLSSFLSQCSKTCGRGLRKRSVFCRSTDPGAKAVVVPDSMCRQHHRPKAQETCVLRRCPKNERLQWIPTPWGEVGEKRHEAIEVNIFYFLFKEFEKKFTLKHLSFVGPVLLNIRSFDVSPSELRRQRLLSSAPIIQGEIHHRTETAVSQPAASVDQNAMQHQDSCFIWTGKTISSA